MTDPGTLTALSRQLLIGMDLASVETKLPTATLRLLLEGLIELAEPPHQAILNRRAQEAHMARVTAAGKVAEGGDGSWT